jgi:hypothetical protein
MWPAAEDPLCTSLSCLLRFDESCELTILSWLAVPVQGAFTMASDWKGPRRRNMEKAKKEEIIAGENEEMEEDEIMKWWTSGWRENFSIMRRLWDFWRDFYIQIDKVKIKEAKNRLLGQLMEWMKAGGIDRELDGMNASLLRDWYWGIGTAECWILDAAQTEAHPAWSCRDVLSFSLSPFVNIYWHEYQQILGVLIKTAQREEGSDCEHWAQPLPANFFIFKTSGEMASKQVGKMPEMFTHSSSKQLSSHLHALFFLFVIVEMEENENTFVWFDDQNWKQIPGNLCPGPYAKADGDQSIGSFQNNQNQNLFIHCFDKLNIK